MTRLFCSVYAFPGARLVMFICLPLRVALLLLLHVYINSIIWDPLNNLGNNGDASTALGHYPQAFIPEIYQISDAAAYQNTLVRLASDTLMTVISNQDKI